MKAIALTFLSAMLLVSCGTDASGTAAQTSTAEPTAPAVSSAETTTVTALSSAQTTASVSTTETVSIPPQTTAASVTTQTAASSAVSSTKRTVPATAPPLTYEDLAQYADPDTYAGLDFYYSKRELLDLPDTAPQTDEDYAEIAEILFQNEQRLYDYILQIHADNYDRADTLAFASATYPFYFMRVADPHYQTAEELHAFIRKVFSEQYITEQTDPNNAVPFYVIGQEGELDDLEPGDLLAEKYDDRKYRFIAYRGSLYRLYYSHILIPFYYEESARVPDLPIYTDEKTADRFLAYVPFNMSNSEHKMIPSYLCLTIIRDPEWCIDKIDMGQKMRYFELNKAKEQEEQENADYLSDSETD